MEARWRAAAAVVLGAVFSCAFAVSTADEPAVAEGLDVIRARLKAEAGVTETWVADAQELPLVTVTVLAGDTHQRLALDLTGTEETGKILRAIAPKLVPGKTIAIPRAILRPKLADPGFVSFRMGGLYSSLWTLVCGEFGLTKTQEVLAAVRNLQRLNHIPDPAKMHKGKTILVPEACVAVADRARPALAIKDKYLAKDLKGIERDAPAGELEKDFAAKLKKSGQLARQKVKPPLDLVVIHTTEHGGTPFDNVARYLQKNQLANYLIGPDGAVYRIVPEELRSYGCGESLWDGRYEVDHEAVNVEIFADTAPGKRYTGIRKEQYAALRLLLADLRARRPEIHPGRVVTHSMVALAYRYGTRSRKGDPYEFDWAAAGLPDNSLSIDQDVLLKRAKPCEDKRYADRVTSGQSAAVDFLESM